MADASTSRRWQVFLVLGLLACVASFYFLVGGGTFAAVSSLVALSITLLNAFLSPATAKEGENWFVGAMKRTLVVGRYAKVVCVLLWIAAIVNVAALAWVAFEKKHTVDIEGVVIDKLRGTPLEKALVSLKLLDGTSLSSEAPAGHFKFTSFDRRKVARDQAELEAVCEGVHGKASVDLSKGSVKDVRIVLAVSTPPTKRMYFVLKGHAVDILVRDKKLPTELEAKLGGNIFLVDTPAFRELRTLMDKFSERMEENKYITLESHYDASVGLEWQQRHAALKRIEKEQLKRLRSGRVFAPAGGQSGNVYSATYRMFDSAKLPANFFPNGSWSIELAESFVANQGLLTRDGTRLDIPVEMMQLSKFGTRADFDALRRTESGDDDPEIRFVQYISRNGMPLNFLHLSVLSGKDCDGEDTSPSVELNMPDLQLGVVVLENIADKPVEVGEFHFRVAAPAAGEPLVRTAQENAKLFAGLNSKSEAWYSPRMLRPGEKLAVPLDLTLSFRHMGDSDSTDPDESERQKEARLRSRECAEGLSADKQIQTIAIVYEMNGKRISLARMPKQIFIDALRREPPRFAKTPKFVYGPSIALDAIDVNGASYAIEPFNPAYVSYFSGIFMGSCPFVYCRGGSDDKWLKKGAILRGLRSKAVEGTDELTVQGFDGTLRITEEEAEISYIDQILIHAKSLTGEQVTIRTGDERLARKDGRYVVLKKGESIDIKFAIPTGVPTNQVRVSASGYFEPTSPMPGR
jgi:hypothetical protein